MAAILQWPSNAAQESAIEALIILKDVKGGEYLREFLIQELTREMCIAQLAARNQRIAALTAGGAKAELIAPSHLEIAIDALRFYAQRATYPTTAVADQGHAARRALSAIGVSCSPLEGAN